MKVDDFIEELDTGGHLGNFVKEVLGEAGGNVGLAHSTATHYHDLEHRLQLV
jgi:hypothetical protein